MGFKSGFIAIIGCPYVGKSTIVNQFVGQKVSIVSNKPQTTRNRIQSVVTRENYQMVFIDTPGVLTPHNRLGEYMLSTAFETIKEANAVLYVVDAKTGIGGKDMALMEKLKKYNCSVVMAVNKIDAVEEKNLMMLLESLKAQDWIEHIVPVSAIKGQNMEELEKVLEQYLEEGPMYFPKDMITDQPERFLMAELIREKALKLLQQEIPHGIGVEIEKYVESGEDGRTEIYAAIYCEKDSHKGIIIGKNGSMLKEIGTQARKEMQWLLASGVYLELWVRVKADWRNSPSLLKQLGYE